MGQVYYQCLLGMCCNDFAMIAADQTNTHGVLVLKDDEEKVHKISDSLLMGVNGDAGDTTQFAQYIAKNIQLYRMKNMYPLSVDAVVHFTRRNLADSLRNDAPYKVNLLIGGYDEKEGGQLYYIDFLAACVKVPYATHGFGGLLSMSILDRFHKPTLTEQEAYQVLTHCVQEVHRRLFIKLPNFQVSVVSKDGVKQMPVIATSTPGQYH
ncbi:hypothetical protein MSG28_010647 [Choristoneura fumiferana]|uniref:Uncharacterized protein n=1 Tax=Choristoneura fumiferana TaxID=7141 RepID=A0ACC0KN90_CHOFU|nr:hypothetical protein MSG28_010647 [Choristoneura fumiferana]